MIEKEVEVQGKYSFNTHWVKLLPLCILVGIIPLIVQLVIRELGPTEGMILGMVNGADLFSRFKAYSIMLCTGVILFMLFLIFDSNKLKKNTTFKVYYSCIAVFLGMTVVSTLLSEHQDVAIWGAHDRAEGAMMIACYMIILLYTTYIYQRNQDYKFILYPLIGVSIVMMGIGYFQYIGQDPFVHSDWAKQLIIPEKYSQYRESLQSLYSEKRIYGTLFHYNYVGSFCALLIPIFLTLTLFIRRKKAKLAYLIATVCSIGLLVGSTSRGGLIGIAFAGVAFLLIFGRKLIKHWKITGSLLVLGVVAVIGVNQVTGGGLFERVPTLIADILTFIQPSEIDYKDALPVRGIRSTEQGVEVTTQTDQLYVNTKGDTLAFVDGKGESVDFTQQEMTYSTQDARFANIQIEQADQQYYLKIEGAIFLLGEKEERLQLMNQYNYQPIESAEAPSIGFEGKETMGSARGYIWSRTFPMLKETWLVGKGPDTYIMEFPQYDFIGKWGAYGTTNMIVDKPHNLYLQIAANQGGVALVAFLVMIGVYLYQSFKLYMFRKVYEENQVVGSAVTLGIIGYLGAGFFNDSVVSVAPIFWILLGMGMAINYRISSSERSAEKRKKHGIIHMKSRKHVG